jgi:adenylate cyclase
MPDVFISHAGSTETDAGRIAEALRGLGYQVWLAAELPAHGDFSEVIEQNLKAAKAVLVVWSADAVKSQWVRAEAEIARAAGVLIQLSLDGASLPLPFNRVQCADLRGWTGDAQAPGWKKVVASVIELVGAAAPPVAALRASPPELPGKPSIAVLPFANLSGDPEQAYFTDGMVVEIVTALSRFPTLFVIASSSGLTFRDVGADRREIARLLGVRYLLEGSVRKSGERVRISVELMDARENVQVWTERFDGTLEDVFALQDTVANAVAAQIAPAIEAAEVRRATARPTADLDAYDLYLRAFQIVRPAWTEDAFRQAIALLEAAIARDPDYALAAAYAARCYANLAVWWTEDPQAYRETALQLGKRALRLAPNDPDVLTYVAVSIALCGGDLATADAMVERALVRNPGLAPAWWQSGFIKFWGGRADVALQRLQTAARLDPHSPTRPILLTGLGYSLLLVGRIEEAVLSLQEAVGLLPDFPNAWVGLAAALASANRPAEAREALQAIPPSQVQRALDQFRDADYRERLRAALALAGADV